MALRPRKRVGVIGLGIIGSRVAAALRASGHQVFVWNRTPKLEANFLGSPAEVAKVCPVLQIFVADGEALIDTIDGMQGELNKEHVILGHATVGPECAREAAELVAKRGAQYLDAPFTGSRLAAESRQLVYYVGGRSEALDRARGVLMSSAKQVIRMGEVGQASAVKIATNIVTAATIEGLAEAMALVQKAGVDSKYFMEAMVSNANYSPVVALKLPKMIAEDFEPHFSLKNMFKDLHLALRMAEVSGVRIPTAESVADTLFDGLKQGWGDLDFSATVKRYLPEESPVADSHPIAHSETPVEPARDPHPPELAELLKELVPDPPAEPVVEHIPLPVSSPELSQAALQPETLAEPAGNVISEAEHPEAEKAAEKAESASPPEPQKKRRFPKLFGRKASAK